MPLSIINVFIAAVWHEFVIRPSNPNYLLGWGITTPLVIASVAAVFAIYRASAKSGEFFRVRGTCVAVSAIAASSFSQDCRPFSCITSIRSALNLVRSPRP